MDISISKLRVGDGTGCCGVVAQYANKAELDLPYESTCRTSNMTHRQIEGGNVTTCNHVILTMIRVISS